MVDAIGAKAVTGGERVVRATPTPPVQTIQSGDRGQAATQADPAATPAPSLAPSLVKSLASEPPVDTDRVAQVKQAIAEGTYPILPGKIADAMIAERLQWMADDKA